MNTIPRRLRSKIIAWAEKSLFDEARPDEFTALGINLFGGYQQKEAFIYLDGRDYYLLGKRFQGRTDLRIKLLRSLDDLPAIPPDDVPADVFERLDKKTRPKKGWIRRSLPSTD